MVHFRIKRQEYGDQPTQETAKSGEGQEAREWPVIVSNGYGPE